MFVSSVEWAAAHPFSLIALLGLGGLLFVRHRNDMNSVIVLTIVDIRSCTLSPNTTSSREVPGPINWSSDGMVFRLSRLRWHSPSGLLCTTPKVWSYSPVWSEYDFVQLEYGASHDLRLQVQCTESALLLRIPCH